MGCSYSKIIDLEKRSRRTCTSLPWGSQNGTGLPLCTKSGLETLNTAKQRGWWEFVISVSTWSLEKTFLKIRKGGGPFSVFSLCPCPSRAVRFFNFTFTALPRFKIKQRPFSLFFLIISFYYLDLFKHFRCWFSSFNSAIFLFLLSFRTYYTTVMMFFEYFCNI